MVAVGVLDIAQVSRLKPAVGLAIFLSTCTPRLMWPSLPIPPLEFEEVFSDYVRSVGRSGFSPDTRATVANH
jgi:hypothetical protein